ncbi:MAG: L-threonylcarbamoyladenylate synthase, partial [Bacteroidetes bacterium]|nr:L-threonylcarbamoyladenylate synthase [Bacteroidota bacterium]
FELKRRDKAKPILVLIPGHETVEEIARSVPEDAEVLMRKFWPGPLTIIFKASPIVSPILTARSGKVGVRLSSNQFCRELLSICKIPITSTSANLTGEPNTDSIESVNRRVLDSVDLIVDSGKLGSPIPSTVVDVTTGKIRLVREGVIAFDEVERAIREGS